VARAVAVRRWVHHASEPLFTSHGGEEGYFGHGPINHEKVYEVPFVEGKIR